MRARRSAERPSESGSHSEHFESRQVVMKSKLSARHAVLIAPILRLDTQVTAPSSRPDAAVPRVLGSARTTSVSGQLEPPLSTTWRLPTWTTIAAEQSGAPHCSAYEQPSAAPERASHMEIREPKRPSVSEAREQPTLLDLRVRGYARESVPRADPRPEGLPPVVTARSDASRRTRVARLAAVALALAAAGIAAAIMGPWSRFETAKDAHIESPSTEVSAAVGGTIKALYVSDNQRVRAGDLLVELDPAEQQLAVELAGANVAEAEAALDGERASWPVTDSASEAAVASASAELASVEADVLRTGLELEQLGARLTRARNRADAARAHERPLTTPSHAGAIALSEFDLQPQSPSAAPASIASLQAELAAASERSERKAALLRVTRARVAQLRAATPRLTATQDAALAGREAGLAGARAQLRAAQHALAQTKIHAPVSGTIALPTVNMGERIAARQTLLSIYDPTTIWVIAHFQETQLDRLRPEQTAQIRVPALGLTLRGSLASLAVATTGRLRAPSDATDREQDYDRLQRVRARITLTRGQSGVERLRAGMSVEARVKTR